jgi:hypothetical protein
VRQSWAGGNLIFWFDLDGLDMEAIVVFRK